MKIIPSSRRNRYIAGVSIFLMVVGLIVGMVGCGSDQSTATKIQDWYGLDAIRENLGGNYLLMNDLDSTTAGYEELASTTANGGKGWEPTGTSDNPFTGILDGQGYEIMDLFIDRPDEDYVGLLGYVGQGGTIVDIGAINVVVTGHCWVGGLVGCNEGTITDSYSIGNVIGEENIGGLVGYDSGNTVSNSYYNHDESLINGENMITTGALSGEAFEEWLANSKFLDVSERLSQEDGYYLIESVSDFKELLAFGWNATLKFKLTSDLDLSDEPNFYIPYLAGEFDGNGHIISNLSLNLDAISPLGLFGYLILGGTITGVGVENVNITGDAGVGGLVGYGQGTVSNSYANGNVIGNVAVGGLMGRNEGTVSDSYATGSMTGNEFVGGLIGINADEKYVGCPIGADVVWGIVNNCYANGNVTGKGLGYIAGLVGWNQATVSNSYFDGNVIGEGEIYYVGGLVGRNDGGIVSGSYATGGVTGWLVVGGLVADNTDSGTVSNSLSTGNVIGYTHVGGLVGQNCFGADVSNSYSIGSVIGVEHVGGLVGVNVEEGTVSNSFWDTETSGQAASHGGTGKTTAEMQDITTFSGATWNIVTVANPGIRNPSHIWNIVDDERYPFLSWQSNVPVYEEPDKFQLMITSTDGGEVTEPGEGVFSYDMGTVVNLVAEANEGCHFVNWIGHVATIANVEAATTTITMNDNYIIYAVFSLEIRDWYDLDAIRDNLLGHHILMNDLDSTTAGYEELASPTANQGKGWKPIGSLGMQFGGSFDGQGYEIRDLFINRPIGHDDGGVGLFQWISAGGVIKNVGVVNVSVTGSDYVGGLVSCNEGTVSNSYSTGSVTGEVPYVGGLVGDNSGTVSDSYSTASVTGEDAVGGLVGNNDGTVTNSYATGSVTGKGGVGGLVGQNYQGTVSDSYSAGNVMGDVWHTGGLVGTNIEATVINSYSTGSVTSGDYVGGLVGTNAGGTVSNSYSTGDVTGDDCVGGLVGQNDGPVSNSYSTASVTSKGSVGGLVGQNYQGTVSNSYSTGNVTGEGLYVGGLVGNSAGTVSNSFWDTETSGQATSAGGTGKTTAEMQDITTFSGATWNIVAVANPSIRNPSYTWNIVDDETYPFLSWQS